jgi:hypothetical protein
MLLFLTTGIGNGSTYRMIPVIFRTEREREAQDRGEGVVAEARRQGLKEGAFALGFIEAIAVYGGFIIPRAFEVSLEATGGPQAVLMMFIAFYVTCVVATWYFYCRRNEDSLLRKGVEGPLSERPLDAFRQCPRPCCYIADYLDDGACLAPHFELVLGLRWSVQDTSDRREVLLRSQLEVC